MKPVAAASAMAGGGDGVIDVMGGIYDEGGIYDRSMDEGGGEGGDGGRPSSSTTDPSASRAIKGDLVGGVVGVVVAMGMTDVFGVGSAGAGSGGGWSSA